MDPGRVLYNVPHDPGPLVPVREVESWSGTLSSVGAFILPHIVECLRDFSKAK